MKTYRVEKTSIRRAETMLNEMASSGWRFVQATPNIAAGYGLVMIFERDDGKGSIG